MLTLRVVPQGGTSHTMDSAIVTVVPRGNISQQLGSTAALLVLVANMGRTIIPGNSVGCVRLENINLGLVVPTVFR